MNINKTYEAEFFSFIECLDASNSLEHVIVIGSWAEYLYFKSGLLSDFEPTMKTMDVDFLVRNLNKPSQRTNLIEIAKERGFIYSEDVSTQISRFVGKDNFEVEFLIQQLGSGSKKLPRTKIGINAQQLTHLEVLRDNTITVEYYGKKIIVPKPEAYVLQKIIINNRRGIKSEKDYFKIINLMDYIDKNEYFTIKATLSKKEKKIIDTFEEENPNMLERIIIHGRHRLSR